MMMQSEKETENSLRFSRKRSTRAPSVFRRWCVEHFGEDRLALGVVDVAGGQGRVAFELCNENSVDTLVVDPRDMRLEKIAKHWEAMRRRRRKKLGILDQDASETIRVPDHHQDFFEPSLWKTEGSQGIASTKRSWTAAHKPETVASNFPVASSNMLAQGCWKCGPEGRHGETQTPKVSDAHMNGFDGWMQHKAFQCPHDKSLRSVESHLRPIKIDTAAARARIQNCGVLLGFHPDQATDYIVECALELHKPFCIVPCCVYPQHFTHRRLKNGCKVQTTEDLVLYLVELGQRSGAKLSVAALDFPGKNKAVYWIPPNNPDNCKKNAEG